MTAAAGATDNVLAFPGAFRGALDCDVAPAVAGAVAASAEQAGVARRSRREPDADPAELLHA